MGALCVLLAACGTSAPATQSSSTPTSTPTSTESPADVQADVHASFAEYKKAALAKDGNTVAGLLAKPSLEFYDDLAKLALTGTEEQVKAQPVTQRVTVYMLRGEFDAAALKSATSTDVVRLAIEKGLISESSTATIELGEVTFTGDKAEAEVSAKGQKAPFRFEFLREDGVWKFDFRSVIDLANGAMTQLAKKQNMTEDQLVDQVLTVKYGAAKAAQLHKPLEG